MKPAKRDEATLILMREVASLAGLLIGMYAVKFIMRPDSARNLRMSIALFVKRTAQRQANTWQNVADHAATSYQKARL